MIRINLNYIYKLCFYCKETVTPGQAVAIPAHADKELRLSLKLKETIRCATVSITVLTFCDWLLHIALATCEFSRTASVVWWSQFLATDPEARVRFPALPEKM
jgi:hypothetical protein